jgi:hypothetical protein
MSKRKGTELDAKTTTAEPSLLQITAFLAAAEQPHALAALLRATFHNPNDSSTDVRDHSVVEALKNAGIIVTTVDHFKAIDEAWGQACAKVNGNDQEASFAATRKNIHHMYSMVGQTASGALDRRLFETTIVTIYGHRRDGSVDNKLRVRDWSGGLQRSESGHILYEGSRQAIERAVVKAKKEYNRRTEDINASPEFGYLAINWHDEQSPISKRFDAPTAQTLDDASGDESA